MRAGFRSDRRGATAIEFAILMPLLCVLIFGAIGLCIGLWKINALENVTAEAARCVAIRSATCGSSAPTCAADDAGKCFVLGLADTRGLYGIDPAKISLDTSLVLHGVSFTAVSVDYPFAMFGFEWTLKSSNRFPNDL